MQQRGVSLEQWEMGWETGDDNETTAKYSRLVDILALMIAKPTNDDPIQAGKPGTIRVSNHNVKSEAALLLGCARDIGGWRRQRTVEISVRPNDMLAWHLNFQSHDVMNFYRWIPL